MIADHEANVVYVADTLERKFPDVHVGLRTILERHGIPLRIIPATKDIWCRDYMPIQVAKDRFVQFMYAPDYLGGRYKHLRADGEIGPSLPVTRTCARSEIVLDGGNVVAWTDKIIVCDKVFGENPRWKPSGLLRKMRDLFGVGQVIVIPTEPGDVLGHADGVARFIDGDAVLANDYKIVDGRYRATLRQVLRRAGLEVVELPYLPRTMRFRGIPPAFGCYLNYLRVGRVIVLPGYGLPEDDEVLNRVQRFFPGSEVQTLDCSGLSREGGVLNCASWTVLMSEEIQADCLDRATDPDGALTG